MNKIFTLCCVFLSTTAFGQYNENWSLQYQTTTAANYSNEGRKIVTDINSNVFILGDYTSDLDSTGHPAGGTQYSVRLHKYDFMGALLDWRYFNVKGMVTSGFDNRSAFGLEIDPSGNVYIGYSVVNASGNHDVVIQKFSNALGLTWTYTYSTQLNDVGVRMSLNGSTVIAVVRSYDATNVTYSVISAKSTLSTGTPLCSFDVNQDVINGLFVNSSKTFYVTGSRLISGAKTVMTAAVSSTGSIKWKVTYNHNTVAFDDYGSNIIVGNDGFIYVIGTTYTNGMMGNDGVLIRYNPSGNLQWLLLLNQGISDVGSTIVNASPGFLYAGCSNTTTMTVYRINANNNGSINTRVSYAPVPGTPYTSITGVSIADMKVATSNNVYVCGTLTGTSAAGNFSAYYMSKCGFVGFNFSLLNALDVIGEFSNSFRAEQIILDSYKSDILFLRNNFQNYSNHSSEKVDLVDLDGGVSLRMGKSEDFTANPNSDLSIYPNPATDKITVVSNDIIISLEISDVTGKIVKSIKADVKQVEVSIHELESGLYFCRTVSQSGDVSIRKFFVD